MTVILKFLILLGSIGTSSVGCYAAYNSLFSSSPQVKDQAFNDGFDLKNVDVDKYLKIDPKFLVRDLHNNHHALMLEINNLVQKKQSINPQIYNSEEKWKQIDDLKKLNRELDYKLAVRNKLISKIEKSHP